MWLSRYVCLFMIYSFMGWIYETLFCTMTSGKWENRGFLYGPICPIYGVGAIAIVALLDGVRSIVDYPFQMWQIFLIATLGSMVLEYVTSWTMEKLFHAVWWDYSNLPLNLHGRISLFTSLGFGCAGLLVVYVIAPFAEKMVDVVPPIGMELCALLAMGIFSADMTLTVSALTDFEKTVARIENEFNERMDNWVDNVSQKAGDIKSAGRSAIRRVKRFRYRNQNIDKFNTLIHDIIKRK